MLCLSRPIRAALGETGALGAPAQRVEGAGTRERPLDASDEQPRERHDEHDRLGGELRQPRDGRNRDEEDGLDDEPRPELARTPG